MRGRGVTLKTMSGPPSLAAPARNRRRATRVTCHACGHAGSERYPVILCECGRCYHEHDCGKRRKDYEKTHSASSGQQERHAQDALTVEAASEQGHAGLNSLLEVRKFPAGVPPAMDEFQGVNPADPAIQALGPPPPVNPHAAVAAYPWVQSIVAAIVGPLANPIKQGGTGGEDQEERDEHDFYDFYYHR